MAENKNPFLGLIRISTANYDTYAAQKVAGKLVFADVSTGEQKGKYIYANGIEYKVADGTDLNNLIKRVEDVSQYAIDVSTVLNDLSTYIYQTVNASIDDLSTRISNISITAENNKVLVNNTSVLLAGDDYISLTSGNNTINASIKESALAKGSVHTTDVSLATKGYVDDQIAALESALEFKGEVNSATALDTARATGSKGDVYVATAKFQYPANSDPATYIENGDLIIFKTDAVADQATPSDYLVVERNLDGAVTSGDVLTDNYVILGSGDQAVKVSTIEVNDLLDAIRNANSAIQTVNANSSTAKYVEVQATTDSSIVNISIGAKTHDVSTATSDAEDGLATAKATKEYVDAQVDATKVSTVTLNSSTPLYVETSAEVSADGKTINASVGVITATLADASNGSTGLALAQDVHAELIAVEEVMATATTTIANSVGLNQSFEPGWSQGSGINEASTYREVIEDIHAQIAGSVVNSITAEQTINGSTGLVAVTADTSRGDVTLTSEVLLASYTKTSGAAATATGLATDAYVQDYVADQLAWAVITD